MLTTRAATVEDASLITAQRRAMFEEAVVPTPPTLDAMASNFEPWVRERLENRSYLGWIVEEDGRAVAGAGLWIMDFPPHFLHTETGRGYLLNFYVAPAYRGRGVARDLLAVSVEAARRLGLRVVTLHASRFGKPLYEQNGFHLNNEMITLTDGSLEATV